MYVGGFDGGVDVGSRTAGRAVNTGPLEVGDFAAWQFAIPEERVHFLDLLGDLGDGVLARVVSSSFYFADLFFLNGDEFARLVSVDLSAAVLSFDDKQQDMDAGFSVDILAAVPCFANGLQGKDSNDDFDLFAWLDDDAVAVLLSSRHSLGFLWPFIPDFVSPRCGSLMRAPLSTVRPQNQALTMSSTRRMRVPPSMVWPQC